MTNQLFSSLYTDLPLLYYSPGPFASATAPPPPIAAAIPDDDAAAIPDDDAPAIPDDDAAAPAQQEWQIICEEVCRPAKRRRKKAKEREPSAVELTIRQHGNISTNQSLCLLNIIQHITETPFKRDRTESNANAYINELGRRLLLTGLALQLLEPGGAAPSLATITAVCHDINDALFSMLDKRPQADRTTAWKFAQFITMLAAKEGIDACDAFLNQHAPELLARFSVLPALPAVQTEYLERHPQLACEVLSAFRERWSAARQKLIGPCCHATAPPYGLMPAAVAMGNPVPAAAPGGDAALPGAPLPNDSLVIADDIATSLVKARPQIHRWRKPPPVGDLIHQQLALRSQLGDEPTLLKLLTDIPLLPYDEYRLDANTQFYLNALIKHILVLGITLRRIRHPAEAPAFEMIATACLTVAATYDRICRLRPPVFTFACKPADVAAILAAHRAASACRTILNDLPLAGSELIAYVPVLPNLEFHLPSQGASFFAEAAQAFDTTWTMVCNSLLNPCGTPPLHDADPLRRDGSQHLVAPHDAATASQPEAHPFHAFVMPAVKLSCDEAVTNAIMSHCNDFPNDPSQSLASVITHLPLQKYDHRHKTDNAPYYIQEVARRIMLIGLALRREASPPAQHSPDVFYDLANKTTQQLLAVMSRRPSSFKYPIKAAKMAVLYCAIEAACICDLWLKKRPSIQDMKGHIHKLPPVESNFPQRDPAFFNDVKNDFSAYWSTTWTALTGQELPALPAPSSAVTPTADGPLASTATALAPHKLSKKVDEILASASKSGGDSAQILVSLSQYRAQSSQVNRQAQHNRLEMVKRLCAYITIRRRNDAAFFLSGERISSIAQKLTSSLHAHIESGECGGANPNVQNSAFSMLCYWACRELDRLSGNILDSDPETSPYLQQPLKPKIGRADLLERIKALKLPFKSLFETASAEWPQPTAGLSAPQAIAPQPQHGYYHLIN